MVCTLCLQGKKFKHLAPSNPSTLGRGRRVGLRSHSTKALRKTRNTTPQSKVDYKDTDGASPMQATKISMSPRPSPSCSSSPHNVPIEVSVESVEVTHPPLIEDEANLKEAREGFDYRVVYHDGRTTVICDLHLCMTGVFSSLKAFANHAWRKH